MARQPQYKRQRRYDETDSGNKPVKDELADLSDDFACAVPAAYAALYFATLAVTGGVGWSIHLWAGAAVLAGATGLLLSVYGAESPSGALRLPPIRTDAV